MLARCGQNKDIKIWEVTTGTELMSLLGKDQFDHNWSVCTAFSPDGLHLVGGSDIGKLKLYEVLPSGEEKIVHNGHWRDEADDEETENRGFYVDDHGGFQKPMEYWIGALTFTPDGSTMISGSRDCTIKFWDMPNLEEGRTLKGHSEWIRNLIVSQDGKVLVSASDDGTVKCGISRRGASSEPSNPTKALYGESHSQLMESIWPRQGMIELSPSGKVGSKEESTQKAFSDSVHPSGPLSRSELASSPERMIS